jgi:hypothetical protein
MNLVFISQKWLKQQLESVDLFVNLADAFVLLGYYLRNVTALILRWDMIGVQKMLKRGAHLLKHIRQR